MRKVKMNVQGRVQGVGFRYMTKMVADQLGVTGTVKNEDDGSVTIEAIGNDDIIQKIYRRSQEVSEPKWTSAVCGCPRRSDD